TTITGSGISTMTFTAGVATQPGSYPITITGTAPGLTHSTSVSALVQVPAAATFIQTDTTTKGTWKGVYGSNGFAINSDITSYPAYAQVAINGPQSYVWSGSTTDIRALQKGSPGATDRIASTWYSGSSFTIDVNLVDGNLHRVALYALDWDAQG